MRRLGVGKDGIDTKFFHILFIALLVKLFLPSEVFANQIELAGQGFIPDPNEEVTVYIQTDVPLLAMVLGIEVAGDATITSAMCEADCNE